MLSSCSVRVENSLRFPGSITSASQAVRGFRQPLRLRAQSMTEVLHHNHFSQPRHLKESYKMTANCPMLISFPRKKTSSNCATTAKNYLPAFLLSAIAVCQAHPCTTESSTRNAFNSSPSNFCKTIISWAPTGSSQNNSDCCGRNDWNIKWFLIRLSLAAIILPHREQSTEISLYLHSLVPLIYFYSYKPLKQ